VAAGVLVPRNPLWPARSGVGEPWFHGVADERAFYGPNTGVFARLAPGFTEHRFVVAGRTARRTVEQRGGATDVAGSIGFYGYYAGPRLRIIDVMSLSDPFLARLPMARPAGPDAWRIGHFKRDLPAGYTETVSSTINRIEDPRLAKLYDDVRLVTTGPLFSRERWRAIIRLNLGSGSSR
jgi:arabinofuranosyltransferase